jgi:hypothetical protein
MATDIVQGLFGLTPETYQAEQNRLAQAEALRFAQLDPFQQANYGLYMGGRQLGGVVGQALGAQDPTLQRISTVNALSKQFDVTTPEGLAGMSKAVSGTYPELAIQLANQAQAMQQTALTTQKAQLSLKQEENLRSELAALGAGASQEEILGVITKYGSADKVLAALQASSDRAAQRQQAASLQQERLDAQKQMAQDRLDAQIQAARERGDTAKQIAQMQIDGRKAIAEMTTALKQQTVDDKKQKEIEQRAGTVSSFDTALDTLETLNTHPGKKAAVGFGGASLSLIPGTDAAGFAAQLETFKAQTFLPQVAALKGMGALSDAEGKKLTAAVGALSQSMKQSEFDAQISKIKRDLTAARARVASTLPEKAIPTPASVSQPKVVKFSDLP